MNRIKEEVACWIESLIDEEVLAVNEDGYIEYTQEWLNEQLIQEWYLDAGYNTRELLQVKKCFEEYTSEIEREVEGEIIYEAYDPEIDEIYREYDEYTEILTVTTKKIA